MIARANHLHDERLFDCYLADRAGDIVDRTAAEHLLECGRCETRFHELAAFMDTLRVEGDAEADEVFTPERLWDQHQAILGRVEQLGRPARVISFPDRVSSQGAGTRVRVAPRWLAAAAAAGLFVGVAVGGMFFDQGATDKGATTMLARSKPQRTPTVPTPVRVTSPASIVEPTDDDRFLADLENALQNPRTRELIPFDALTPHARGISARLR